MLFSDVKWGDTLCVDCRKIPADGLFDDDPTCIDCADRRLDRICAIEINPSMAYQLPPLLDRNDNGKRV